ncbi:MAG: hypothetical protein HRU27_11070 [Rhizobiaceae bacterium]|nr:hypothetical protein [Hyphomicrobiales bacterium]NRB31126.1 hypothetical protein [Rhizobiaceae bacterium]
MDQQMQEIEFYAKFCQHLSEEQGIPAWEVALNFSAMRKDENGDLYEPVHHGKRGQFWFDVAEHIKPDLVQFETPEDEEEFIEWMRERFFNDE